MKKKCLLAGLMLVAALGLTACGNPLKSLPEVDSTNWADSYDEDKETYGNAAVDRLVKQLKKDDIIKGDLTGFVVYDRDDNEDSKEKSEVSVEITCETEAAEYTEYYVVTMKYDKEGKEWKVKETEVDEKEDAEVKVKYELTEDQIVDILQNEVYSTYVDEERENYIYFYDAEISDAKVTDTTFEKNGTTVTVDYAVDFNVNYKSYIYSVSGVLKCELYPSTESYTWGATVEEFKKETLKYHEYSDFTMSSKELDPEVADILSEEAMITACAKAEGISIYSAGNTYYVTADDIVAYESESIDVSSSYAERKYTIDVQISEGVIEKYSGYVEFYYSNDKGWYYQYCYFSRATDNNGNYMFELNDDVKGTYTGVTSYAGDALDDITITVDKCDKTSIHGTVSCGDVTTNFKATYSTSSHYFYFELDDNIKIKRSSYDDWYMYMDPKNGTWTTNSSYPGISVSKE